MEFQLDNLLPSNWVHALGVTLFHSLWMGLILGVITSVIILGTRKRTASLRYNLLTVVLGFFVVAMGFIFYDALDLFASAGGAVVNINQMIIPAADAPSSLIATPNVIDQINSLIGLWNSYAAQIVLIWFLIICAKCIQLVIGLQRVSDLKTKNTFDAGSYWENKVTELAQRMGIVRAIQILQSGMTKVPIVAGHFKPVILVPLGL